MKPIVTIIVLLVSMVGFTAVTYTHLDVYKRQDVNNTALVEEARTKFKTKFGFEV